jgi:hypothetical protein
MPPPESVVETSALRAIRVLAEGGGPIELRASGNTIVIAGGSDALGKLAATLENLAVTPQPAGEVSRHVDLEYFPGHGFLSETSMWMTVTLLPEQSAQGMPT